MAWDGTQVALALGGVTGVLTAVGGLILGIKQLRQSRDTEVRSTRATNRRLLALVDTLDAYIYRIRKRLREHGEEPEPLPVRDDDL
jgi:hypothetical protein